MAPMSFAESLDHFVVPVDIESFNRGRQHLHIRKGRTLVSQLVAAESVRCK